MSMLQEPFFSVHYPMYINYGYTGKAIADKMAEMIVFKGERLIENVDWIHHEKVSCFQRQMYNFISDINVGRPVDTSIYL